MPSGFTQSISGKDILPEKKPDRYYSNDERSPFKVRFFFTAYHTYLTPIFGACAVLISGAAVARKVPDTFIISPLLPECRSVAA